MKDNIDKSRSSSKDSVNKEKREPIRTYNWKCGSETRKTCNVSECAEVWSRLWLTCRKIAGN